MVVVLVMMVAQGVYHVRNLSAYAPSAIYLLLGFSVLALAGLYIIQSLLAQNKKVSCELVRSRFFLSKAQEIAQLGSWSWEVDTNQFYWSPAMLQLFGLDPRHFDGRLGSILMAVHPEDRERVLEALRALPARLDNFPMQYRVRLPDGTVHHIWAECTAFKGDPREATRVIGTVQDITDRVCAEESLRESGMRLQILNQISALAAEDVGVWGLIGRTLGALRTAFPACKIDYAILTNHNMLNFYTDSATPETAKPRRVISVGEVPEVLRVLRQRQPIISMDILHDARFRPLLGQPLLRSSRGLMLVPSFYGSDRLGVLCLRAPMSIEWSAHEIATMQEVAEYLAGSVRELRAADERARAESIRRDNEQRFQLVLDSVSDVIWATDPEARQFIYLNDAVERVCGRPAQAFYEAPGLWWDIVYREDRVRVAENTRHLFEHGGAEIEYRIQMPGGALRWVNDRRTLARDSHGRPVTIAGVMKDITERRRVELQAHQAQKLESLGVMASGFAHQFNNLVMGILSNATLARSEAPREECGLQKSLGYIESNAERAAELCTQLLAYAGKGQFTLEPVNASTFLESMAPVVSASVGLRIRLELQLAAELPSFEADRSQLQQMLLNLISNAAEAMEEEGGVVTLETEYRYADRHMLDEACGGADLRPGKYVIMRVIDRGCGMGPDAIAKIFDPFFTTKYAGRGLGLAAVLGIVRAHRGAIGIHSKLGAGTTVSVMFPVLGEGLPLQDDDDALSQRAAS